ncbi:DUF6443 domain-containing protein [Chitinophaga sp.]|uniref:DUF6443 domain-containing protein n=1 Tax=Chitinophaga sp. TaxID=1869181 RepID=UPI0031DB9C75
MRKISICLFLLVGKIGYAQNVPLSSARPTATPVTVPSAYGNININYVRTWEPSMPTADTAVVNATTRTVAEVKMSTEYMDGLGRTLQKVNKGISPRGNDVIAPVTYDAYGREQYSYLPYTGTAGDGSFKTDPFNSQKTFYQDVTINPGAAGETVYYGQTIFEASPLNRVLKTYAPGNSWAKEGGNKPVENQYLVNNGTDSVVIWSISGGIPTRTGYYTAGTLYKNVVIDEAGNKTVSFTDKDKHVMLKRTQQATTPGTAHVGWLNTYYVYDDLDNLVAVLPPLAVEYAMAATWSVSAILNELCFQYQYDERKRMISKRVPGAGAVYMVYDVRDRLVFTQDSVQRTASPQQWLATFYDNLDRQVMTAIYNATTTRAALQASMNTATATATQSIANSFPLVPDLVLNEYDGSSEYKASNSIILTTGFNTGDGAEMDTYLDTTTAGSTITVETTNSLPSINTAALTPLTYTFYDNYNFNGKLAYVSSDFSKPEAGSNPYPETLSSVPSGNTKGMVTGGKVRVLGTNQWLTTTNYYNDKGRMIQVVSDNHAGGKDVLTTLYDFNGKILSTYLRHKNPLSNATAQTTLLTVMTYDNGGRLVSTLKRINDNTANDKIIAANTYYELGQLQRKRLNAAGSSQLDSLTYHYNIRGWIAGINKAYVNSTSTTNWFGEEVAYDNGFTANQINGNIAGVKWKSQSNGIPRSYGFSFDKVNRLTQADFTQQNTPGDTWKADKMNFTVKYMTYDANGNINSMHQEGMDGIKLINVDQLKYTYQGGTNKLIAVKDTAVTTGAKLGDFTDGSNITNEYVYDGNGNIISDANRGISSITYNLLNLPATVVVTGKGTVTYLYDAAGTKLKKTVVDNTSSPARTIVTDYLGGFVYQQDTLQYLSHEEGRIRPLYATDKPVNFTYDYFEKDHLDNIRIVLGTKSDTAVYAATMETATGATENALFSNIDNTRTAKPVGYPEDNTTSPNDYVAKLNGVNGQKIGPSLVLRVMAGDTIAIVSKAFYKDAGASTSQNSSQNMLSAILQAFSGSGVSDGSHGSTGTNSPISSLTTDIYDALKNKDATQNVTTQPKAYLNYAAFDDQFNLVDDNSGVRQVKGETNVLLQLEVPKMVIKKTGFIYIYESNESGQDVYFDNLVVVHNAGPLLEETHYYPYGLTMAAISSKALKGVAYAENYHRYNANELQKAEFSDGSGLEWYDFNARVYDQQLGRFSQIDPKIEEGEQEQGSPYQFAKNNPAKYNDPDGKCPACLAIAGRVVAGAVAGAVMDYSAQVVANKMKGYSLGESFTHDISLKSITIAAGSGAISGGLSSIKSTTAAGKYLMKAVGVAISAAESVVRQVYDPEKPNEPVSVGQVVIDASVNLVVSEVSDRANIYGDNSVARTARQLDRAERVLAGNTARASRQNAVNALKGELKTKKVANTVANSATSVVMSAGAAVAQEKIEGMSEANSPVANENHGTNQVKSINFTRMPGL